MFGGGVMSSSGGQRFPARGKSTAARNMVIHGGQVLSTYTHVSGQWSTYGTKIALARPCLTSHCDGAPEGRRHPVRLPRRSPPTGMRLLDPVLRPAAQPLALRIIRRLEHRLRAR